VADDDSRFEVRILVFLQLLHKFQENGISCHRDVTLAARPLSKLLYFHNRKIEAHGFSTALETADWPTDPAADCIIGTIRE